MSHLCFEEGGPMPSQSVKSSIHPQLARVSWIAPLLIIG